MYTLNSLSKSVIAATLLSAGAVTPAVAISIADDYIGSANHGYGDVIGATADFDIMGMDISVSGTLLTVSINTNFAGKGNNVLFPSLTGGVGIGYGDLFLSSAWNPSGAAPYAGDNATNGTVWTYGFSLDNRWMDEAAGTGSATLYSLDSGVNTTDALLSQNFLTGGIFRNGQEVAVNTRGNVTAINSGTWDINVGDKTVNFYIDLAGTNLLGSDIAVHWGMTCANDVIEGVAPAVPVPAAVWLFGSGLLGLVGVARRKAA
jgi:hypothetical protein